MRTRTARYDKKITFLEEISTRDGQFNTAQKDFVPIAALTDVAANVQDLLPSRSEQISDGIDIRRRPCRIRFRWRSDVLPTMRVRYGNRELEIISGPVDLGRRETLEMVCEEVSTRGNGA